MKNTKITIEIFYESEKLSKAEVIQIVAYDMINHMDPRLWNLEVNHRAADLYLFSVKQEKL